MIACDDESAPEGARVGYRVAWRRGGQTILFAPVELVIPAAPTVLTLHSARYDATAGSVMLSFSLPRGPEPVVELIDVAGRRIHRENLHGLDPGEQKANVRLARRVNSGMYFLRLSQRSQMRVVKLPVVR